MTTRPLHHFPLRIFFWVTLFAIAFAWVEASVVVYLRDIFYPAGFVFPLKAIPTGRLWIELIREAATIVMLMAIAALAGTNRWKRFAWFAISFGVWDIFFYIWLWVTISWPASLFDWDILFLLPVPWIAPVIAPVLVSAFLIAAGMLILRTEQSHSFTPPLLAWGLALFGSGLILWTFMRDTDASIRGAMPQPYDYAVFAGGLLCYVGAMWRSFR